VPWHLKPRSASIFFLVSVVLPTVLQAVASVREVLELQVSAAEHSVYSGIVYRCSISACKVEGFNGGCVYIYMYLSIHTHIFFFLKSGAGFLAICCILELKYPIYMPTWLLAFGFGFTWLHLAFGFWLLAFGRWLR
jgi:hypothetical protein